MYNGNKVGYFTSEEISPLNNKCKQVVEELNKIFKGLSLNSQPTPQSQPLK